MIVFLNGRFVPQKQALVSAFDRSFLFGDGLFETLLVRNARPFLLRQHLERLQQGARFLRIPLPFSLAALREYALELLARNKLREGSLRLTLSRGVGRRGYSPAGAGESTVVMTTHSAEPYDPANPPRWRLVSASSRLPVGDPLTRFKTCNKLPQILARAEAEDQGADEALLLNTDGRVVEGSRSNLFWVSGRSVGTPPLESGVLAGVTRAVVMELCESLGLSVREAALPPEILRRQDGVFLTLSTDGVVEALAWDGRALRQSPVAATLRNAYWRRVRRATA